MKTAQFTMNETGHTSIMNRPSQISNNEYNTLKADYLKILETRQFKFDTDKIDNRRTIECVKANKLTINQLKDLIEINRLNQELLNKISK